MISAKKIFAAFAFAMVVIAPVHAGKNDKKDPEPDFDELEKIEKCQLYTAYSAINAGCKSKPQKKINCFAAYGGDLADRLEIVKSLCPAPNKKALKSKDACEDYYAEFKYAKFCKETLRIDREISEGECRGKDVLDNPACACFIGCNEYSECCSMICDDDDLIATA